MQYNVTSNIMKFATKAIHAGWEPDPATGAVMPPIYMTSTFELEAPGQSHGFEYTRADNPNFAILEKYLASLEEAKYATVFSSGMGALTAMVSTLSSGDKVVALDGIYGGTYRLFKRIMSRFGIEFINLFTPSPKSIQSALELKPKWLMFETPTNPLLNIFDIEELSRLAKSHGVLSVVDNTFASPYFQNPLQWGADIVWHSSTKYLSGHSDVLGGVVLTQSSKFKEELNFARKTLGVNPSPFDCWLITRGIKTLALRMEQHQKNAHIIAKFFKNHPKVKKVHYPGLPSNPHYSIAQKQMRGFSGMLSVEFDFPIEKILKLVSSFRLFSLAQSLGGVESLVCHPTTMTHGDIPQSERELLGLSDEIVRFSIGIENAEDLCEDLERVLSITGS